MRQHRHALDVLELPAVLRHVAGYATSPLGAAAVADRAPSMDAERVREELARVEEAATFAQRVDDWLMPALPDARAALERLALAGSTLDPSALRDLAVLLTSSRDARAVIVRRADAYPLLAGAARDLIARADLQDPLDKAVDEAGDVRDGASRELARLRRELRGARSRVVQKLERFAGSLPERYRVPDASVSVRQGRYVIAIRREGRGEVGGLVHDESATGATLFVEPPIAIELTNQLRDLERAETREVQRVLAELTDLLRPHRNELAAAFQALITIDSLFARARYALAIDAHTPVMGTSGSPDFAIMNGRHPLLLAAQADVVPFDLVLDPGERTLLVSGPNTGGKTVLLKAVGLISLMAQAGIIPPVGPGTRLPVFRRVFADIGDEQSIEASLSTFSAHLKNLREVVDGADHESLALIDEIGSGTDPAEGAALADAILRTLTERGVLTFATTHLGQLKLLAGTTEGVVNASLQFDSEALQPTYRLIKGMPGRSYGLAIAKRLGFPGPVLDAAEQALPRAERDVSALLAELERKDAQLVAATEAAEQRRIEAEHLRAEAEALRARTEDREASVDRRERMAERDARRRARELLLEARREVEQTVQELRQAASAASGEAGLEEAIGTARRRIERQAQRQRARAPELAADGPGGREPTDAELAVGQRVRVAATGAEGTILELREGRAVVDTGGPRISVPATTLSVIGEAARPAESRRTSSAWSAPDFEASSEIDLRGVRADEVEGQLLPALDAAIQAGLSSFRVIHGKGTGALREVVTELLRSDRRIAKFRAGGVGEGGAGVTVVELP